MAKKNLKLLARVRDHILEEPRRYNQGVFGQESGEAPCGTRACIAGWAALLGGAATLAELAEGTAEIRDKAQALLGLDAGEADILFHGDPACSCGLNWPTPYARRHAKAKTPRGRARAAADYIDFIIRTGKVTER